MHLHNAILLWLSLPTCGEITGNGAVKVVLLRAPDTRLQREACSAQRKARSVLRALQRTFALSPRR